MRFQALDGRRSLRAAIGAALYFGVSAGMLQPLCAQSATTLLVDLDHRPAISLDGDWHTIVDPYFRGLYSFHHEILKEGFFMNASPVPILGKGPVEYNFKKSPTIKVPGDWNTQRETLYYYEGPLWYERDFQYTLKNKTRVFLHVGAANYQSQVFVNAKLACEHEGGFTPFDCDVTSLLHDGDNFAVIVVDSTRRRDGLPTLETDWWNYGGLTRSVSLVEVPETFIDDYDLHLNRANREEIDGYVHVQGGATGSSVEVSLPEVNAKQTSTLDANGRAPIKLQTHGLKLWSPDSPKLYKVKLQAGADALSDDIGFRTIEVKGTQILLNGKPIFLQGVCVHAEAPYRTGRASSEQDVNTLLKWAQELGANYVRLAHYPHDEKMTRAADRLGILVWSEIPVYWAVQFESPEVLAKAEQQLSEMIRRDRNKASVILWSVANETPNTPARTKFLGTLAAKTHELDASRLVTAALLVRSQGTTKIVDDPLGQALDVIGANEYIGWYEQTPASADQTTWQIAYDKPLIISEFGGDAKAGLHGAETERWTEEYQASIYRHQLAMLNRIPKLRGMSPWLLMDFRSPSRLLPGIQDDFNRKGLISDQGVKKQSFSVLQKAYRDHTVGKAE